MKKIFSVSLACLALTSTAVHAAGYEPYYYSYAEEGHPASRLPTSAAPSTVGTTEAPATAVTTTTYSMPSVAVNDPSPVDTSYDPSSARATVANPELFRTFPAQPKYVYSPQPQEIETPQSANAKKKYWTESALLTTRSGIDVGFGISNYHYREPGLDVSLAGEKGSVDFTAAGRFYGNNIASAEFRFAIGTVDYSGSGRSTGKLDYLFDIRGLYGYDFAWQYYGITPYVGLGYRTLNSDERGLTSTNAAGYRRNNQIVYIPVGATQRFRLTPTDRLSVRAEYDHVFYGLQRSYLSDAISGYPDLDNPQHHGSGVRAEILWETPYWSVGPFASYWAIAASQLNSACGTTTCVTGYEPHNNTIEAGLRFKFHAFDF